MAVHTPAVDILADGHIHTRFCRHAIGEMEDYVRAAIGKGLREICFLEHMESGISYPERTWLTEADFDAYFAEGRRLQQAYRGRIAIGLGVEVGYNPEYSDELRERLASRQWSRIGLSFHYARIPGDQDHLNLVSRKAENIRRAGEFGADRLLEDYVEVLRQAVQDLPATVLCHLDAALRYLPGLTWSESHLQQVDQLLAAVKSRGMAVEINTSGLPVRGEPFPSRLILRMVIDHDIPLVAGSDAHRPEDVGRHFDLIEDHIRKAVSP
jgi:histidinol-phosphatase (PHP family)